MTNQFTDIYKKLPTSKLLEIVENRKDYQALAVETARLELASRPDIDSAKESLKEKSFQKQKEAEAANLKRQVVKEKALKVLEYADPLVEKAPEKNILIICVVLLLLFLYKTTADFGSVLYAFKHIKDGDFSIYWFLLEYFYLPISIFFLWRKSKTGWTMFLIWLIYQIILDFFGLYMCYKLSDIPASFPTFMPMPSVSTYLALLAFHGGLIYYITRPSVKALFFDKLDADTEVEVDAED